MKELDMKVQKEDAKKDHFNKLHKSIQNIILMASADNSNKVADALGELCQNVINCETAALVDQKLNYIF
eukprot:269071-Ditylum_brightwellii.AAC.1